MSKLKEKLMLSEKGYSDLKKAITACTITNIVLLLPSMVACLLFWELLKPFTGEAISWDALWKLLGLVKAVYWRNNFVGLIVETARPGAGGGYSGIPGREKRL